MTIASCVLREARDTIVGEREATASGPLTRAAFGQRRATRERGPRVLGAGMVAVVMLEVLGTWTAAVTAEEPADPTARTYITLGLGSAGEWLTA